MTNLPPLPYQVRADLFLHLATMERSGLPADKAWALLQLPQKYQARVVATRRNLARGLDLASSGGRSSLWTQFEAALIHAAQTAGDLTPIYTRLADYYNQRALQWAQIKKRLSYPAFLLLASLLIQPLPQLVSGAMSLRYYVLRTVAVLCLLAFLIIGGLVLRQRWQMAPLSPKRLPFDRALLLVPIFGALHRRRALCDLWSSLALLLGAGVAMFEALPLALKTINNTYIVQALDDMLPALQKGATLAQAVQANRFLHEQTLFALVQTGEAAGRLEEMLARYARDEDARLALAMEQVAQWLPRIAYALVVASIVSNMFSGSGLPGGVPDDL